MNIKERFGEALKELYKEHSENSPILKRGFAINESIEGGTIIFIGLNPSYTLKNEPANPEEIFYSLAQRDNYKYFKKFEEISKCTRISWSHLDLLTIRETRQKKVLDLVKNEDGLEFIWKHLLLTKQILEALDPKVIVVANTAARMFLGKDVDEKGKNRWLDYKFKFDDNIGTYRVAKKYSGLNNTPVFFTSMLTGQRALDNGSFDRLKWHINYVLNQIT